MALSQKLKKLIPRLASEYDGEVIATVRAIRRVLRADQHDLHDLASLIIAPRPAAPEASPPPSAEPPRPTPQSSEPKPSASPPPNREPVLIWLERCMRLDECFEYLDYARDVERSFLRKMKWRLDRDRPITIDECIELERLWIVLPTRRRKYRYRAASQKKRKMA
jgi:hypothetical protein